MIANYAHECLDIDVDATPPAETPWRLWSASVLPPAWRTNSCGNVRAFRGRLGQHHRETFPCYFTYAETLDAAGTDHIAVDPPMATILQFVAMKGTNIR